jgi:hypothetical protein
MEKETQYFYNQYGTIVNAKAEEVLQNEEDNDFKKYAEYLENRNEVGFTEIITKKDKEQLRKQVEAEYAQKISDIVGFQEAIEQKTIEGKEIPQEILDQRSELYKERDEILRNIENGKVPNIMPKPDEGEGEPKPKENEEKKRNTEEQ